MWNHTHSEWHGGLEPQPERALNCSTFIPPNPYIPQTSSKIPPRVDEIFTAFLYTGDGTLVLILLGCHPKQQHGSGGSCDGGHNQHRSGPQMRVGRLGLASNYQSLLAYRVPFEFHMRTYKQVGHGSSRWTLVLGFGVFWLF